MAKNESKKCCSDDELLEYIRRLSPEEVKITFKDPDRKSLIIKNPKEAYWCEDHFKYIKHRKEHHIHRDLIAELEILHKDKKIKE